MTEISQKRSLALVALCWSMTFVRIVLNMKTVKYILYMLFVVSFVLLFHLLNNGPTDHEEELRKFVNSDDITHSLLLTVFLFYLSLIQYISWRSFVCIQIII